MLTTLYVLPLTIHFGQQDTSAVFDDLAEYIFENSNPEEEDIGLYELIEYYIDNPVNVNNATVDELAKVPALGYQTATQIINHINEVAPFTKLEDLLSVKDIDTDHLKRLFPFLTLEGERSFSISEIFEQTDLQFRSRLITDIQERKGFSDGYYEGNPYKIYNRIKTNYSDKIGITVLTDKDAGEKSYNDFTSFNLWGYQIGPIDKIIFGDYLVEHGEGLAIWSPYGISKGRDALSPANKKNRSIIPYTSSNENNFFRGAAAEFEIGDFTLSGFYSSNNIDASYDSEHNIISSLPEDGYHRTESEISRKDKVNQKVTGGKLLFNPADNLSIAFLYFNSNLNIPIDKGTTFGLEGTGFRFYSIACGYHSHNIFIKNEFAFNGTSVASINNLELLIHPQFSFLISVRSYPRNYYNLYSQGFGEGSNTQNEFGVYTGMRWKSPAGVINFYFDQFKFPFATYYNPVPTSGNEFMIDYQFRPMRNVETKLSYKNEVKEMCEIINDKYEIVDQVKHNVRFEIKHKVSKQLILRTRVEYVNLFRKVIAHSEEGFLVFEDIKFQPINNLSIYCRLIFFQTDSYDTRLYQFENDLTGVMSNSPLYGEGTRWYILVKYKLLNMFQLSFKYHEIYKPAERYLSSGLNEIEGNIDNRISAQIDVGL